MLGETLGSGQRSVAALNRQIELLHVRQQPGQQRPPRTADGRSPASLPRAGRQTVAVRAYAWSQGRAVSRATNHDLVVGQLRRHVRLGSEAVYRVCDFGPESVWVEVVRVPGLSPGERFKFSRDAVIAMEVPHDPRPSAAG